MTSHNQKGFTLIELLIVIAIIGILSTMALPSFQDRVMRAQVQEGIELTSFVRQGVADYYREKGRLPADNRAAALPAAEKIVGNYVDAVTVENGVITVTFGGRSNANLKGKKMSIRPAVVAGEPRVPVAWVYGYASVPAKMTVAGQNGTDIPARFLPVACRF